MGLWRGIGGVRLWMVSAQIIYTAIQEEFGQFAISVAHDSDLYWLALDFLSPVTLTQWVWLSSTCDTCRCATPYIPSNQASSTASLNYDFGQCQGTQANDQFYITNSAVNITFVAVSEVYEMGRLGTLCGMAVSARQGLSPESDLLADLVSSEAIQNRSFSLYLSRIFNYPSYLYFGGYNLTQSSTSPASFITLSMSNHTEWALPLLSVQISDESVAIVSSKVLFDVGNQYLMMPFHDYLMVMEKISVKESCNYTDFGDVYCKDRGYFVEDFPDIVVNLGGFDFVISSKEYMYSTQSSFVLLIHPSTLSDYWLLGAPFLRGHLTYYDAERYEISIAGGKMANNLPTSRESSGMPRWQLAGVWIAAFVIVAVIICGMFWVKVRKTREEVEYRSVVDSLSGLAISA